jgi:aspartate ammonia-lyase
MAARRRTEVSSREATATRIERDLLGELEIPQNVLYGIRTARSLHNLSFSGRALSAYPLFVRALVMVKRAAARANRDARVFPPKIANAIEAACDQLAAGDHPEQFPVDVLGGGGGIAINLNLNEVIANLANEILGGTRGSNHPIDPKLHLNASQSTADVCQTAAHLAILEKWTDLRRVLDDCIEVAHSKAVQFESVQTLARTCLQDASAVSLGEIFGGYAAAIARRSGELDHAVAMLRKVNLGGTVIGDGSGAPPAYRRTLIGHLNKIAKQRFMLRENLFDAAQNIDDLASVAAQLGLLAEVLIKVAQDLRLLSSGPKGGFGEITLPAVQEGSSFYPGKINPVMPETLLQACFQVLGCERAARLALEHGELYLNVFEGAAAINVMDAMEMLSRAIPKFSALCLAGIVANEARCRELAAFGRTGGTIS